VAAKVDELNRSAAALGCAIADPFMTMSFLALPVVPSLKLTDMGLVDVEAFAFVSPFS
jgi:adenine deaminase